MEDGDEEGRRAQRREGRYKAVNRVSFFNTSLRCVMIASLPSNPCPPSPPFDVSSWCRVTAMRVYS
jgi:hypothetical protein